jgi:SSS family solute:Na+ symporter
LPGLLCLGLINNGELPDEIVDSADTYAFMIRHLLPEGLKGLVAAALLAALMSTVSGALNSTATLFCYDLYKQWKPETSERKLVTIGRIATFVAMLLAILWSPFLGRFETVFQGINAIICYIAPPITVVFVAGVFWRGATAQASIVTLIAGTALGFVVFLLDWFKETTHWDIPFMMASFYLACICTIIMAAVSLLTPKPLTDRQDALVWKTPMEAFQGKAWKGLGNYKVLSVILLLVMVTLYYIFN